MSFSSSTSFTISGDDASAIYLELRDRLLLGGRCVSPRGQKTLEIPAVTVVLEDPTRPAPTGVGRGLVGKIGAAEGTHLIGGLSDANQLIACAKNFKGFVEGPAGDRLMGAYGPRAYPQWENVIRQLSSDTDTRQAGLNIWRPDELPTSSKDVPCTLSLWYMVRDGRLEAYTTMRSQDLVWGSPYDWMQFTAAQRALAFALGIGVGTYHHHCYSLHAYVDRDDIEAWEQGQEHEFEQPLPYMCTQHDDPYPEDVALKRWRVVQRDMERIVGVRDTPFELEEHAWQIGLLGGTLSGGRLCPTCRYVLPETAEHWRSMWECRSCSSGETVPYA